MRYRKIIARAGALAAFLLVCGCHHPEKAFPEAHPEPWTPSEVENLLGGEDPLEGFNRSMFACTDFLMNYVADPLGRVYTTILPRPFIEHFHNVCVNLEYPARLMSSLLQAEWEVAGTETVRFFANTTLGLAGIFDVARAWWDIPAAEADFGQAFARWGIGPGETFMLPVAPTLNGRDLIGLLFDTAFDLKTYIPYAGYATFLNRMVIAQQGYDQVVSGSLDPYKNFRQLMLVRRELQLRMYFYRETRRQIEALRQNAPIAEAAATGGGPEALTVPGWIQGAFYPLWRFYPQDPVTDSLRSVMFQPEKSRDFWYMPLSLFNSDFLQAAYLRKVELVPDRPKLVYAFWKAPKPAGGVSSPEKLLILLPGIGGSCTAGTLIALAEQFQRAGFAVLGLDSTFSWRFVQADGRGLPGFLPDDAERVRAALRAVLADLKRREWITAPEITLCGYSMGGLQTLKLAEMEHRGAQLGVRRFIAVNPPVSTAYALRRIDALVRTSANWNKSELLSRLIDAGGPLMMKLSARYPHFDPDDPGQSAGMYQVPLERDSARYLVGLSLKLSMREMLLAVHKETPLAGFPEYRWGRRNALYLAFDRMEMADYAEKLLLPRYPDRTMAELLAASDLRSLEPVLSTSPDVRVFHSFDDFLLSEADREWLDATLGPRIVWLSHGGHLGGLYYRGVGEMIVDAAGE
ncbi:MAG: MlaA family lipoprotein [Lentisphaeria bacterium]|nr:MlaA family lipoprotein [Lentisphaeria bacterium]